jgi:hypothetical protein
MDFQVTQVDAHGWKRQKTKGFQAKKTTKVDIVNYDFDDEGGA